MLKNMKKKKNNFGEVSDKATHIQRNPKSSSEDAPLFPSEFEVTDEYKNCVAELDKGTSVVFVSGKAGTGKSTLIQYIRATSQKRNIVLAYTGVSAMTIGGQTINSFFGFPWEPLTKNLIKAVTYRSRLDLLNKLELLIIDEVSMLRADFLDGINWYLQKNRTHGNGTPFGGVQILLVGDMFQLPPIASQRNNELQSLLDSGYPDLFFFCAKSLRHINFSTIELTKIFRQENREFQAILNKVREGKDSQDTIEFLNQRCPIIPDHPKDRLCITSRVKTAQRINDTRLRELPGETYRFPALYEGSCVRLKKGSSGTNDKRLPAPDPLELKIGAQVMLLRNDNKGRWVNGSMATVLEIDPDENLLQVKIWETGLVANMKKETWEEKKYKYNEESDTIQSDTTGIFSQYPLNLAWATTIHKAQSKTIDKIHIDLQGGAFASGQTYVALSRCPSVENISLARPLKETDIKVSETITRFFDSLS